MIVGEVCLFRDPLDIEKRTPTKVKPWMRKCVRILIGAIFLSLSSIFLTYAMYISFS